MQRINIPNPENLIEIDPNLFAYAYLVAANTEKGKCPESYNPSDEHPDYRLLASDMAQETLKKLAEAWKSYFKLRVLWKERKLKDKPGLVKYRKKNGARLNNLVLLKCSRAYSLNAREVAIVLPKDLRDKDQKRLILPYRGQRRYTGKGRRAELHYDQTKDRWYFHYTVQMPENRKKEFIKLGAIDLGVRVLASLSVEGQGQSYHFSGREMLKEWDYWGRQIAIYMKALSHRPKTQ